MSNFNKVVTNIPVSLTETEMSNLSQTLSGIIQGGGGGGEGKRYIGDGVYVTVNNDANPGIITLTQTSLEKLNKEIPSAVSSFPDSIQYAKKTYVDNTFQTKDAMSAYWTSAETRAAYAEDIAQLRVEINGKQNKLTFAYDNDKISAINGSALAGQGGVTGDYYSASNPSGFITPTTLEPILQNKHYVTSSNEIIQGSAQYGLTTAGWTVIQGAGGGTGITEVSHDITLTGNGNSQALGVNFNHVQPKGNYVSSTDISDMATQTWVGNQGYLKVIPSEYITDTELQATLVDYATNTLVQDTSATITSMIPSTAGLASETDLQIVSAGVDYVSAHAITAHQSLTNYYTKDETSGATELSTEFSKYIQTISTGVGLSGDGKTTSLGIDTTASIYLTNASAKSAVSALSAENAESARYTKQLKDASKTIQISDITALQNWASSNSSTWDGVTAKLGTAQYAIDSATFVTSSSNTITGTKQYALTTAGWTEVQGGSTFTGVTTTGSISGGGVNNDTIGLLTSAENALTAVANKVDKPDTTQTVLNNNYLIYSTLTGEGTTTGWMPLSANYYSKTEADGRYVATADVGSGLYYSGSSPKLGVKLGTDLAFNSTTSAIQINTDGSAWGAYAFVEGSNTTASGAGAHAEGVDAGAIGQGAHAGGYGTHTTGVGNFIHGTFLNFASPDGTTNSNTPVFVGGTLNATTAQDYNDHGGYLQIMGNGTYTGGGQGNNSDAYILYRDGSISAAGKISANGMFAVSTEATLFGQSRISSVGDTTALGTNWMGVTNDGQGFLKSISGNNVGSLNGTSIQINYKPNNAYGEITVKNSNAGTDGDSKIVHVPTASYNNMTTFDPTNGPNYMLRKTASGFDIGAKVVNVTSMPQNTEANTYYFVYEV